ENTEAANVEPHRTHAENKTATETQQHRGKCTPCARVAVASLAEERRSRSIALRCSDALDCSNYPRFASLERIPEHDLGDPHEPGLQLRAAEARVAERVVALERAHLHAVHQVQHLEL